MVRTNHDGLTKQIECGLCQTMTDEHDTHNALFVGRICPACESAFQRVRLPKMVTPAEAKHRRTYAKFLKGKAYPELAASVSHTRADGSTQYGTIRNTDFYRREPFAESYLRLPKQFAT